jgi:hypothetical protein
VNTQGRRYPILGSPPRTEIPDAKALVFPASTPQAVARTAGRRDRRRSRRGGSFARDGLDVVEYDQQRSGNAGPRAARRDPAARHDRFLSEIMERGGHVSASNEPISFEQHIKPLFREDDRRSMEWAFDLWSHDDVVRHSDAILERLRNGTMPCDGAWSDEQVAVFRGWIEAGRPA